MMKFQPASILMEATSHMKMTEQIYAEGPPLPCHYACYKVSVTLMHLP